MCTTHAPLMHSICVFQIPEVENIGKLVIINAFHLCASLTESNQDNHTEAQACVPLITKAVSLRNVHNLAQKIIILYAYLRDI